MATKLRTDFGRENTKLEQEIAEMKSALFQQKARLINDTSISSKATGNSKWLSGAKGQLSGYRSHKGLPQNEELINGRNGKETTKPLKRAKSASMVNHRSRTQSSTPVLVTKEMTGTAAAVKTAKNCEPGKRNSRVKSAPPTRQNDARRIQVDRETKHKRALSLQGGTKVNALQSQTTNKGGKLDQDGQRRVSFDLDDDVEPSPTTGVSSTSLVSIHSEPVIKKTNNSLETGSSSERIAHLKAKVIAKASANVKAELIPSIHNDRQKSKILAMKSQQNNTLGKTTAESCKFVTNAKSGSSYRGCSVSPSSTKDKVIPDKKNHQDYKIGETKQICPHSGDGKLSITTTISELSGEKMPASTKLIGRADNEKSNRTESSLSSIVSATSLASKSSEGFKNRSQICQSSDPERHSDVIMTRKLARETPDLRETLKTDPAESFVEQGCEDPRNATNKTTERKKSTDRTAHSMKQGRTLSADVVSRSLTSGVLTASTKLKLKQEQELKERKRQDRHQRAKRAERDKMALQHAQRQQEKLEHMQSEEGADIRGGETDGNYDDELEKQDGTSVDFNIQGEALLSGYLPSKQCDDPATTLMSQSPRASQRLSSGQSPEDRLKDLELNIQGILDNNPVGMAATQVDKLQQQLESLKRDLAAGKTASTASAEPMSRPSTQSRSVINRAESNRGVYSSMSKNELMREVRKQKEQHKKQIRLLESELSRLKHRDPVQNCELPEGDVLYHKEDIIGEGTFSQVFRGCFNGSEVAIKRLKVPLNAADRNYFAEEVSLLHELRHPRVVLLLGVCTAGPLPLMVLEYMAGSSLYARINKSSQPLDHVSFYQIARDITLGMNYLHRHRPQVLHLDLKSMNVLLGLHGRAKIGDFGFAKLRHEAQALEKGKVQGTPAWMAPELLQNTAESLTEKVDVYSFGVILWEMFTGLQPYKGLSVFQVLEAVQLKKRPDIPESCPQPLCYLITTCWDHKPNKRPSFKNILISLEALAIPLEWRSLLSAADIPRETMEDPTSARSIIAFVNESVQMSQCELDKAILATQERVMASRYNVEIAEEKQAREVIVGTFDSLEDMDYDSLDVDHRLPHNSLFHSDGERHPLITASNYRINDADSGSLESSPKEGTSTDLRRPSTDLGESSTDLGGSSTDLGGSSTDFGGSSTDSRRPLVPNPPPIGPAMLTRLLSSRANSRKSPRPSKATRSPRVGSKRQNPTSLSLNSDLLMLQRTNLKTTETGPHPSQLPSLSEVGEQKMTSIAEILKKAVAERRTALREDVHSLEHPNGESLWSTTSDF